MLGCFSNEKNSYLHILEQDFTLSVMILLTFRTLQHREHRVPQRPRQILRAQEQRDNREAAGHPEPRAAAS
jgi:hypothetical protein